MSPLSTAIAVGVLSHLSLTGSRLLVPLIALQDGASALTVGVLGVLFSLLPMLGSTAFGRLLDRIGPRAPVLVACAMAAAGMVLGAAWPTQAAMFLVAPLVGAGAMLVYVASTEAIGSVGAPAQRARNFSWLSLGYSASAFGGPLMAGLLLDRCGRTAAFGVLAVAPALSLALAVAFRRTWRAMPNAEPSIAARSGRMRELLAAPGVGIALLTGSMTAGAHNLIVFVIPIHATQHGFGAAAIGQVLATYALGAFTVRAILPWLAARLSSRRLIGVALMLSALAYALLPVTVRLWPLLALALALGMAIGLVQPTVLTMLYEVAPPGRLNETSGLNVALNMAAQTMVPLLFGVMGGAVGIGLVCWLYASGLLLNVGGLGRLNVPPPE